MMLAIYFLGVADKVEGLVGLAALLCAAAVLSLGVILFCETGTFGSDSDDAKRLGRWLRRALIALVASSGLFLITPNSKTIAAMYVVPAIVNNEQIQGIAGNSLKALEELTQQWLKDLSKEATEGKNL